MKQIKQLSEAKDAAKDQPIYDQLLSLQHKAANYMNCKTAHWSPVKSKVILIAFCLVAGNGCLWLIARAFTQANGPPAFNTRAEGTITPPRLVDSTKVKLFEHIK